MRVSNNANQSFEQSGQGSQQRQQAFKQRKQLGQAVLGTVTQELKPGLAWVNVDGLSLLAELPFAAAKGQSLLLRIEQLEPQILLKFLRSLHAGPNNQMGLYANLRNKIDLAWQNFLSGKLKTEPGSPDSPLTGSHLADNPLADRPLPSNPLGNLGGVSFLELPPLSLGEPFPAIWLQAGCQMTATLQDLFQEFLKQNKQQAQPQPHEAPLRHNASATRLESSAEANRETGHETDHETGQELGQETDLADTFFAKSLSEGQKALHTLQRETVTSLSDLGAKAWQHVPWHSPHGCQQELLVLHQPEHKLEQVFLSGVWPRVGAGLIVGLTLQERASLRVYTQNPLSLPETAALLNLAGLPQTLAFARQQFNLPHTATSDLTCLELKAKSPDTASSILLKLSQSTPLL